MKGRLQTLICSIVLVSFFYSCSNNDNIATEDALNKSDVKITDVPTDISSDAMTDINMDGSTATDTEPITDIEYSDAGPDIGNCSLICGKNMHCENEKCVCNEGFSDCNGDLSDGCEADLMNETKNCGSCTMDCSHPMLGVSEFECIKGICEIKRCEENRADCNGKENDGCEANLMTDSHNCNACGLDCGNNSYCEKGECKCKTGFANCNLYVSDGCEINISNDNDNCGKCGNKCGTNSYCSSGNCTCSYGYENCDNSWLTGCETYIMGDKYHCGNCKTDCTKLDNVLSVVCADFNCGILRCKTDFDDCNKDATDGCESNLATDAHHCGNCARDCGNNSVCNNKSCACRPGFGNCNVLWEDGCEIDFNNVRTCGKDCNSLVNCGQNTECYNYACRCIVPFADCNSSWSDGCEIDTDNDRLNCGGCKSTCTNGINYSGICVKGRCAGRYSFARAYGSTGDDEGMAIAKDPQGNTIIAGNFSWTMKLGTYTLTPTGSTDIFVAKLDSVDNSVIIARAFGSTGDDYLYSMAVDQNGDIVITGSYSADIKFGVDTIKNYGGKDVFFVKLNNNLDPIWSKGFSSTGDQEGTSVAIDSNLNIYLAGNFENTIALGGPDILQSYGQTDIFLARFDNGGRHIWSKAFGVKDVATNGYDIVTSITVDNDGFIYITGAFSIRIDFEIVNFATKGSYDIFIVKLDKKNGTPINATSIGSNGMDLGMSVRANSQNEVILSSVFSNTVTLNSKNYTSRGGFDILLVKYDSSLKPIDVKTFGSDVEDLGIITLDKDDNIILSGYSKGTIQFGDEPLTNRGDRDIILAKLRPDFTHIFSYTFGSSG
ncbi:MAG: SBBP repeat-containing protein, partial [Myxococcota bacterium]